MISLPSQPSGRTAQPRPKRIKDPDAVNRARKPFCEFCGARTFTSEKYGIYCAQVHHVTTRGAGGGDVEGNLISLCAKCHDYAHRGLISKAQLRKIIRDRKGRKL